MFKRLVKPIIVLGLMVMLVVGSGSSAFAGPGLVDDSNPGWTYIGDWRAGAGVAGAINGTQHVSGFPGSVGSEAQFRCRIDSLGPGNEFGATIYHTKAFNRGVVRVWITLPGSSRPLSPGPQEFDQYGPGVTRQQSFGYFSGGEGVSQGYDYILHLQVTGQKNPASSDILVDIDAINC